ncbi:hypothetical protein CKAN_00855600 [Cinnamomum micranthum f. kanehirae]|uniref:Uncharacterized protein n=1 Tax=Cinnamomum micranthum f. kanehirae TaxID=337451 RepID=A0A3S3MAG5_9MAGN|nr:hypothetical protein CKAN_00855600 [Cinnamomum micranthum f. kanehirae]
MLVADSQSIMRSILQRGHDLSICDPSALYLAVEQLTLLLLLQEALLHQGALSILSVSAHLFSVEPVVLAVS